MPQQSILNQAVFPNILTSSEEDEDLTDGPDNDAEEVESTNARDIALVLDASSSIGRSNYMAMVENLATLFGRLCRSIPTNEHSSDVRLALVVFSSAVKKVFDFRASSIMHSNATAVRDSIMRAQDFWPCMGGATAMGPALKECLTHVFTVENGMRRNSMKRVLLVTDGKANVGVKPLTIAKKLHRHKNVDVFPVGIGTEINLPELSAMQQLSRRPGQQSRLLTLPSFSALTDIVNALENPANEGQSTCHSHSN